MGSLDDLSAALEQAVTKLDKIDVAVVALVAEVQAGKNPDPAVQAKIDAAIAQVNTVLGKEDKVLADAVVPTPAPVVDPAPAPVVVDTPPVV